MEIIEFNSENKYIKLFLNLSKKLYGKTYKENKKEITEILKGEHSLSKYFIVNKFLCMNNNEVLGRFIITRYKNDNNAYIGYFECINDDKVAKAIFDKAYDFSKKNNCKKIIGPLDASFWIKYRLKINKFDVSPYTAEPYNKDYYFDLFKKNKYEVCEHYTSNIYQIVEYDYINKKYEDRYKEFISKGYKIVSPNLKEFDIYIKDIYRLLTNLYRDFPLFKDLTCEEFTNLFSGFKVIMDPKMVKLAYFENKMVGFFISLPNYNSLINDINLLNIIKILKIRKKPKEYVMLYMGVDQNHQGLGKALAYSIINELRDSNIVSIGALARDGKVTQNYASDLCVDKYEYVLLERAVK